MSRAGLHALCALVCLSGLPVGAAEPVNVRAVRLAELLTTSVYSAPATVVARNQPPLAAEIEARVLELPVEVGDPVAAGDLLARLDCRRHESVLATARADLARSQAQRRFADDQLRRARNLVKNQSISEELLDQRHTDLAVAEADAAVTAEALKRAAIDVADCELRAPFEAVVTARPASVGSLATRGSVIVALLETAGQEVSVTLRHDQAAGIEGAASLVFEGNGTRYPVSLRALLPAADPVARTREARLTFTAEPALAGTAGRIVWQGAHGLLPAEYLVRRDGQLGVFVLDADRARFAAIPDAQDGRPAAVALAPDTRLITDGRQRLGDGDPVHSVPPAETP